MAVTAYSTLSTTQTVHSVKTLLERAEPYLILEQVLQLKPLPANSTKSLNFRRHRLTAVSNQIDANGSVISHATALTNFTLGEGTTPNEMATTMQNVDVTLAQYGAVVGVSDIVDDTHIDDVITEYFGMLGKTAGQLVEAIRWLAIVGDGSLNVILANGVASENLIIATLTAAELRAAVRSLRTNHAEPLTSINKSGVNYGSQSIEPSFVAIIHTDLEGTVRKNLGANFTPVADYAPGAVVMKGEFGNFENIRFLSTSMLGKRPDVGAAIGTATTLLSDSGTLVNLYDVIVMGADAVAGVALKGAYAVEPKMVRAVESDSDPLAQRSKVGFKTMQAAKVLQPAHVKKIVCGAYKDNLLTL